MNSFSPNMFQTYQTCPKKYYFRYIENINVPLSSQPFEKGKKIHALANYYLQGIKIDRIETALTSEEKIIWEKLKSNIYYNKEYLKSEFPIMSRIGNFWVGGRIDAIVHDFDQYYILDYKTGTTPKDYIYNFQTMIYLICLDKYLKNYNSLSFVYINLKEEKNTIINFTPKLKDEYNAKILDICNNINNDNFYKCNPENCKFCEYSKLCNK